MPSRRPADPPQKDPVSLAKSQDESNLKIDRKANMRKDTMRHIRLKEELQKSKKESAPHPYPSQMNSALSSSDFMDLPAMTEIMVSRNSFTSDIARLKQSHQHTLVRVDYRVKVTFFEVLL